MRSEQFEQNPVWIWNESRDGQVPVIPPNPLPEDEDTLFIKARFFLKGGEELDGYLVGHDPFYAIGVFCGDQVYIFNINLVERCQEYCEKLAERLGKDAANIFPMRYTTEVHFPGAPLIAGEFRFQ